MRKQIKKSILNGLIRTFVSIFYFAFAKLTNASSSADLTVSSASTASCTSPSSSCPQHDATSSKNSKQLRANSTTTGDSKTSSCAASDSESDKKSHSSASSTKISLILIDQNDLTHLKCKRKTSASTGSGSSWSTATTSVSESSALTSSSDESYPEKKKKKATASTIEHHEYMNECGQLVRVQSNSRLLQKQTVLSETSRLLNQHNLSQSLSDRIFRVKTVVLFVLFIATYVCLNNYIIIMFFYHKSYATSASSSSSTRATPHAVPNANSSGLLRKTGDGTVATFYFLSIIPFSYIFDRFNFRQNAALKLDRESALRTQNEIDERRMNDSMKYFDMNRTLLLDPQDIEIAGLDFRDLHALRERYPAKFVLLNESFFEELSADDEKYSSMKYAESSGRGVRKETQRPCVHPTLNPYDSEIMQFVKKEAELKCNPKRNWIYVENGTIRVAKSAIKKHGTIVCAYIPLYR
jgi:hypothetical protein